jgi:ATP-binding cassette subfamily F protein 3
MRQSEIRDYLAKFLFSGEDVFQPVETLSGGERGRLALAILSLSSANLLLLDEPTNNLDMPSQEVLQAVLSSYGGTVLLVSHDRYLIDGLATQIWEVLPDEGRLRVYAGDYSLYKEALLAEEAARLAEKLARESQSQARAGSGSPAKTAAAPARSNNRERARLQRIADLEAEVSKVEERLSSVSRALENPPADVLAVQKLGQEYLQLQQDLEEKMTAWALASEED